jgi:hypothetical protein
MFGYPESPIAFGDVNASVANFLRDNAAGLLDGVTITDVMSDFEAGDRVLLLWRSGGRRNRLFDNAYLVFEARGEDADDALTIAENARALVFQAPASMTRVVHVEDMAGPMRLHDPVNQTLFYRFSVSLRVQGTEI